MRKRARRLARMREVQLRELGALVVEMRRLERDNPELIARKAAEVLAIDEELRGLRAALGERQTVEQVVAAGVAGSCARCGTLMATDDRFCPRCGPAVAEPPAAAAATPPARRPATPEPASATTPAPHPTPPPPPRPATGRAHRDRAAPAVTSPPAAAAATAAARRRRRRLPLRPPRQPPKAIRPSRRRHPPRTPRRPARTAAPRRPEGQQVCLECGHDLTRAYRRAPNARIWVAAGVAAVLAVGVGAGFAIGALTNDKQKKDAKKASASTTATVPASDRGPTGRPHPDDARHAGARPSGPTGPASTPTPRERPTGHPPTRNRHPAAGNTGAIASWPAGKSAYTVVLISAKPQAGDRQGEGGEEPRHRRGRAPLGRLLEPQPRLLGGVRRPVRRAGQARAKIDEFAGKGFPGGYPRLVKK